MGAAHVKLQGSGSKVEGCGCRVGTGEERASEALQAAEMVLQEVVQDPVKLQVGRVDEAVEVRGEVARERAFTAEEHGVNEVGDENFLRRGGRSCG